MYFFWPSNNAFDVPKTYLLYQFLSLLAGAAFLISVVCPARLEIGGCPISRRKWMNITHLWRIDFQKNMVKFHGYGDIWLSKITRGFSRRKVRNWLKSSFTFSKWVDSQTLVMAIPRSYMFWERLATAIALWNSAPKWDSCEPVQNMLNVLVTFLNNSGWRVWPQNHLTDVSLAQSSRRNSLMDPKMVWTIANWWGFQFLVISKMERVWIMITVKMVMDKRYKRGELHAVPSFRGSLNPMVCPADFQIFWAIRRPLWLSASPVWLVRQSTSGPVIPESPWFLGNWLDSSAVRNWMLNHAYGLMVYQCLQVYHPLMVKLGLVDPIILPTLIGFIIVGHDMR